MEHFFTLFFHFLGLGLLVTVNVAGFVLDSQYRRAPDLAQKAVILRALKPIGMISPIAIVLMLLTGIGNMHALGFGLLDAPGWLAYKIVFFAIAVISGTLLGMKAMKRGKLVHAMVTGSAPANAEQLLRGYDRQIRLGQVVMPILLFIIIGLSIYGRLGYQ